MGYGDSVRQTPIEFAKFLGKNDRDDPVTMNRRYLEKAENVDVAGGRVKRRGGRALAAALSGGHSLWAAREGQYCFFVHGTDLKRLFEDYSTAVVRSGLTPGSRMSFCEGQDRIFCNNNHEVFYLENGAAFDFPAVVDYFKEGPFAGQLVEFWNGRLWIAHGQYLFYSDAYKWFQFDRRNQFYKMNGYITLLKGVTDGLWVGDGRINVLYGEDATKLRQIAKAQYNAIPGAVREVDGELVGAEGTGSRVILFGTERGLCLGGVQGSFKNLTERRYNMPDGKWGASLHSTAGNMSRFITAIHN